MWESRKSPELVYVVIRILDVPLEQAVSKRLSRPGSRQAFAGELVIAGRATQMIDNLVGREEK